MRTVFTCLLAIALLLSLALLPGALGNVRVPGNRRGYEPAQPIDFSHRLHAGDLEIPCGYCHQGAEKGRYAGIPAGSTCMNCHASVTAPAAQVRAEAEAAAAENRPPRTIVSPELRKLYDALALNEELQRDPGREPRAIEWARVHQLPDFATFDHSAHVAAGVDCQTCHGPVQAMERVRQVESLSMGWCVDCHRRSSAEGIAGQPVRASTDCVTCHL